MNDTSKYLIHADVAADGVVERSDVVGAIFGQTEGLLGDELDLRDLQESSKVGRIDVEVSSEGGQSFGTVTIASSLDRVDTAILAASLETITRVGPCRARLEVTEIEDVREAKRREIVERAKELLGEAFDESVTSSEEIQAEVREAVRVADITEYNGQPAGPRVAEADAVIVVEGRADVLTLLRYGIKNAVGVEGTDVPEAIADLTQHRTVTTFLDGDRGGELILRELRQVGDVDYAAFAPDGRSVEDLARHEVVRALREKVRVEDLSDDDHDLRDTAAEEAEPEAAAGTDGGTVQVATGGETEAASTDDDPAEPSVDPDSIAGHVRAVVDAETGHARLLDDEFAILDEVAVGEAAAAVADAADPPHVVVLDGHLSQALLDGFAEHGVTRVVARETGPFVKRPTSVRVGTAAQVTADG